MKGYIIHRKVKNNEIVTIDKRSKGYYASIKKYDWYRTPGVYHYWMYELTPELKDYYLKTYKDGLIKRSRNKDRRIK